MVLVESYSARRFVLQLTRSNGDVTITLKSAPMHVVLRCMVLTDLKAQLSTLICRVRTRILSHEAIKLSYWLPSLAKA